MYIKLSYDQEFVDQYMYLKDKYPDELFNIEGIGDQLDIGKFSKQFFQTKRTSDSSIDENANISENCIINYKKEASKPIYKLNSLYILWRMVRKFYGSSIANEIIERQLIGDIYIHDSYMIMESYCFNFSCLDIMYKGLPMINSITSLPPKYLYAFKSQIEQFVTIASNSILGATGLADLLLVMSYYVKNIIDTQSDAHFYFRTEEDCWMYVKETLASMIYTLNQPMRGDQSPFTNISIYDKYFLEESKSMYIFPDGTLPDDDTVNKLQELFLQIMNEEYSRTVYTFPVITACCATDDENNIKDEDFIRVIAKYDKKYGFINIFDGKSSVLSSCCRLKSDKNNEYFNSIGGSSNKIGSLGVCTVNLPRLGYKYGKLDNDSDKFYDELKHLIELTGKINNCKRKIIKQKIDEGFMPLYTLEFMSLNKQYSTTGINGMYECLDYRGYDVIESNGQEESIKIMDFTNKIINNMESQYDAPHNVEQVPAEGAAVKLAKKDKLMGYNETYELYSNQFVPLISNADLLDRIHIQGLLDDKFSGGSILHVNVDNEMSEDRIVDLIKLCAKQGVRYFGINYQLNQCVNGHISNGKIDTCSICNGVITDKFHRVVGFIVNIKNFAKVRREYEYPERKWYNKEIIK